MSLQKKLIYLAFLGFFIMIRRRKAATVGQYLTASFSKFVARTSHMTNQRSKSSSLWFIAFEACILKHASRILTQAFIQVTDTCSELSDGTSSNRLV